MTVLHRLRIGAPAHGGHCVARHEGRVVFVRHTAPGELVDVALYDETPTKRFWRGEAITIHEASTDRRPSPWPEAGVGGVGGGELAHLTLPAQRRWKTAVLHELLGGIGKQDLDGLGLGDTHVAPLPGDDERDGLGTRTRIELVVTGRGEAGMHRHRSTEVLALQQMPLAAEEMAPLQLLGPRRFAELPAGTRIAAVAPSAGPPVLLTDGAVPPGSSTHVTEELDHGGQTYRYRVAARGFWQVHRQAPTALVEAVWQAAELEAGEAVLELYAGAGLLSAPIAEAVGRQGSLMAVEGAQVAARDAKHNLARWRQATVRHAAITPTTITRQERADVIILDPPRAGAGPQRMATIAGLAPRRIVYVACDPAALARDVAAAAANGYRLSALRALDLFPHSHHLEVVATLRPARRGS